MDAEALNTQQQDERALIDILTDSILRLDGDKNSSTYLPLTMKAMEAYLGHLDAQIQVDKLVAVGARLQREYQHPDEPIEKPARPADDNGIIRGPWNTNDDDEPRGEDDNDDNS